MTTVAGDDASSAENPAAFPSAVRATLRHMLAGAAFALAGVILAVVAFLDWLVRDYDRYAWVINGPGAFGMLGSGPFQLWLDASAGFAIAGLAATGIALVRERRGLLVLGLLATAVGAAGAESILL